MGKLQSYYLAGGDRHPGALSVTTEYASPADKETWDL